MRNAYFVGQTRNHSDQYISLQFVLAPAETYMHVQNSNHHSLYDTYIGYAISKRLKLIDKVSSYYKHHTQLTVA